MQVQSSTVTNSFFSSYSLFVVIQTVSKVYQVLSLCVKAIEFLRQMYSFNFRTKEFETPMQLVVEVQKIQQYLNILL